MKKKINKLQIFRIITQIIFFILLPGLFTLAFGGLKQVYLMILKGNFNMIQLFPKLIVAFTLIPITILFGRFFCGWICAFGTFNDVIYIISKKIFKIKFRINEKINSILQYLKYVILIVIIYIIWTKGSNLFDSYSPWDAFAQISDFPQAISQYTIAFILLAFITVGAMFIERFFCRYLCPLGAVLSIISKISIFKIDKPTAECGKCRLCTHKCSMGIQLYKMNKVSSGECINCLKCIETCPRKNVQGSICNAKLNPALASAIVITTFTGVYAANNALGDIMHKNNTNERTLQNTNNISLSSKISEASNKLTTVNNIGGTRTSTAGVNASPKVKENKVHNKPLQNTKNTSSHSNTSVGNNNSPIVDSNVVSKNNISEQKIYKDGTYIGVGRGFRPELKISVTIKSDKITNIEILSHNETSGYYEEPFDVVPKEIIQAQSTSVDGVSGATRSSNGIKMAVDDALSQAK